MSNGSSMELRVYELLDNHFRRLFEGPTSADVQADAEKEDTLRCLLNCLPESSPPQRLLLKSYFGVHDQSETPSTMG